MITALLNSFKIKKVQQQWKKIQNVPFGFETDKTISCYEKHLRYVFFERTYSAKAHFRLAYHQILLNATNNQCQLLLAIRNRMCPSVLAPCCFTRHSLECGMFITCMS